ncbi:phosphoribosylformylglycinamidine synthase subunit PurL [Candidatus Mesenet endosymbiont of Agriotes lineatus]|uniref:phosphoribosylformylglycinamidine synthase subunit PurL n=1 Tax=Candidatus Mesenet endosymbiont of Agriotes lineatus TaxID=3077948 RepID=UPI003977B7F7
MLAHPVLGQYCYYELGSYNDLPSQYQFIDSKADWALEISFLPGVTDNLGNTAKQIICEHINIQTLNVKSAKLILGKGNLPNIDEIKKQFNPLIQSCRLIQRFGGSYTLKNYYNSSFTAEGNISSTKENINNTVQYINLEIPDDELEMIGTSGNLGLSLPAMKAIQAYFHSMKRNPSDIELETLAQTWSEHCKHNIFSAPIDDITDGLYQHYIKRATHEINSDICVSVFSDNAGGIIFDDDFLIVAKVETHNSPSALDPFGGAMTGILGVNRDIIGFGKGAKPIMNTYYFCFAETMPEKLYRNKWHTNRLPSKLAYDRQVIETYGTENRNVLDIHEDLSTGVTQQLSAEVEFRKESNEVLPPEFIMGGVIHGVNVGGNCSGIPTSLGSVYFDDRFCGKPLVFVGSLGIIPRSINGAPSHIKQPKNGDKIVIVGGKTGRDGIHGATFSSSALTSNSATTVVQIGDPITQKKLSCAVIEARDLGLYNSITDNGAGGLSSSIGEMGKDGFEVDLSQVLLKNCDMAPWEIWISESQERMTLAVPAEKLELLKEVVKKHDVELCVIGEFTDSGRAIVKYSKKNDSGIKEGIALDIDTDFLHNGNPKIPLNTKVWSKPPIEIKKSSNNIPLATQLHEMMKRANICSKEFIVVQYDHTVQASSVLKPLQGKGHVCAEAVVIRPVLSSKRGVVKSQGFGSSYGEIDTYHMAACAIDTAIRNYVAAGGNINHLALLDNFCWCDSTNPERLWQLKKAAQSCYDYAKGFNTPFISGKDSMFNDFKGYNSSGDEIIISAPPSLLISAVGVIENIENSVSLDVKIPGDLIYVLGTTYNELGRSEYQLYSGIGSNNVPKVTAQSARQLYKTYGRAVEKKIVASAIAPNLGGLIVALIKSLIAGQLGAQIDLSKVISKGIENENIADKVIMFSESQSRIIVTIAPENKKEFEELFIGIPCVNIGVITEEKSLNIKDVTTINLATLEASYKEFHKHNSPHIFS